MEGPAVARVRPSICASQPDQGPRRGVSQHTPIACTPNLARTPRALASAISENSARRAVSPVPRPCRASRGACGAPTRRTHAAGSARRRRDRSARCAPCNHRENARCAPATDLPRAGDATECAACSNVRAPRATRCAPWSTRAPPPGTPARRRLERHAWSRARLAPAQPTARAASRPHPRREGAGGRPGRSTEHQQLPACTMPWAFRAESRRRVRACLASETAQPPCGEPGREAGR